MASFFKNFVVSILVTTFPHYIFAQGYEETEEYLESNIKSESAKCQQLANNLSTSTDPDWDKQQLNSCERNIRILENRLADHRAANRATGAAGAIAAPTDAPRTFQSNNNAATTNVSLTKDLSEYGKACIEQTEKATEDCNFSKNKDTQMAIVMANQMRGQIKAMSMASPALMCSKMSTLSQSIDAAVAGFKIYCSSSYGDCDSACTADTSEIQSALKNLRAMEKAGAAVYPNQAEIKKRIVDLEDRAGEIKTENRKCNRLANNIQEAIGNVGSFAAIEAAKSQYCGEKTDALAELCKAQPSNALCAAKAGNADCSNPTVAASNLTCICQANRNDPRCTALSKTGLGSGFNNTNTSSGSGTGSADAAAGDFGGLGGGEFGGSEPVNMNAGNDGGVGLPGQKSGGRGGGLDMGGGQGGSGKPGANNRGNEGEGLNTKILSGYGVGGSGSSGSRSGGYGGTVGGTYPSYNSRGYVAGNKPGQQPVDLRKFLPGGQMDPSRGLAGVSGPDGITGPNTDIWKKVKSRYFNLQPSLLP